MGGGEKALQKLRLLAKTRARVTIIAPFIDGDIQALAGEHGWRIERREAASADFTDAALAFVAGDDPARNAELGALARSHGVPVNVVDQADDGTFIMPAIVDREPVTVAIGTEGAAPIIAREIKSKIESWLPANFGVIARRAEGLRARVRAAIEDGNVRRRLWERLLQGAWRERVLSDDGAGAAAEVERQIEAAKLGELSAGSVALIGCGPGEPDLITLKAQQRLQQADVLVVDRLVNPAILEYARRDAVRIDAGKEPYGPSAAQDEINRILVREALKGHRVARLKGGDAFIFGRAAEEMAAVRAAGISVEVIPGITAAHACAASAGLPLTLRQKVRQFSVVTGAATDDDFNLDWKSLSRPGQAFAIYMGVRGAPRLREKLLAAGAGTETSVVVVENGSLASERIILTTLGLLAEAMKAKEIKGPAIIFVGLNWADASLTKPEKVEVFGASERCRRDSSECFEKRAENDGDTSGSVPVSGAASR
jgi:uroporphyrin-III C-methyltransferase/precorrin-2 dehydrogenase/sirohydrochlorin ferrochelatase